MTKKIKKAKINEPNAKIARQRAWVEATALIHASACCRTQRYRAIVCRYRATRVRNAKGATKSTEVETWRSDRSSTTSTTTQSSRESRPAALVHDLVSPRCDDALALKLTYRETNVLLSNFGVHIKSQCFDT